MKSFERFIWPTLMAAACVTAQAQTPVSVTVQLDIRAQRMSDAINEFAQQSGFQVLSDWKDVRALQSPALSGSFTVDEALNKLLGSSGLEFQYLDSRTVAIRAIGEVRAKTEAETTLSNSPSMRLAQTESLEVEAAKHTGRSDAGEDRLALEEIVVSATKRDEPLQDIPMSVSVLDEQTLVKQGATNLMDYARTIPNLAFAGTSSSPLGFFTMQIRGVGGGTTGFYIDDVPVPEGMNPRVMDIARIEVLRGPQGSLYGARSMGGTVRLITKRADPTATEFQTHASLGAVADGDQDYAVDSAVNVPIASSLAFRGNAYYQRETGFHDIVVDNPTVVGDEVTHKNADDGEYWGFQAMATWTPTERLTVEPRFMYQNAHLDWHPASDLRPGNFTNRRVADVADPDDGQWSISSLTASWDTGWGRFTSATAFLSIEGTTTEEYSEYMNFVSGNPNYYPLGGVLFTATGEDTQITEEARFASEFDGPLQLTAGVFYSKKKEETHAPCSFAIGFGAAVGDPSLTECVYAYDDRKETKEAAVFGELEYAVLDRLLLTLGGRYFDNTFTASVADWGLAVSKTAPTPANRGKQSDNGFNPKAALKWEVSSDWTLYSSAAKGYRIGGANLVTVPTAGNNSCATDLAALGLSAAPDGWDSDSLWSYEVGSKSVHADRRFSLNAAAFFIDWSDLIQTVLLPSCGSGFVTNTGKAQVKGAEVEIAGQAVDHLRYTLGIGYIAEAQITDPENAAYISKGDPMQEVPKWTLNGSVDYRFNLGPRESYFFLNYSWVDSSITARLREREPYGVLDARLGTTFGKWDIALFGKNLTNEHADLSDNLPSAAEAPGRPRYVTNRPRTIGVDFRWTF